MANGNAGDHPVSDILGHGRAVFSPEIDAIVRELASLMPRHRVNDLIDWLSSPPMDELASQLRTHLERALQDAKERGWEV